MNILYQSCDNLVSHKWYFNLSRRQAMGCIKNAFSLGLEALHRGVPLSSVIYGLNLLTQPTGCGGDINMNVIESANQFQFLTHAVGLEKTRSWLFRKSKYYRAKDILSTPQQGEIFQLIYL
jgi:hypothetical protein